ncbi:MAG: hypothetical protein ABSA23_15290 [Anaerolineales bacterium]|jgi:hypothetical protein
MQINRAALIRIAKETAEKAALSDPNLVAAYLTGSLRTSDPFIGNATDVDIVFVHPGEPKIRREIIPLTPEIHLDIFHHPRSNYEKPKELRIHPWLGPELYDALPLFVSRHFFEFVQAGVRDRYNEPANLQARSHQLAQAARQTWSSLQTSLQTSPEHGPALVLDYLKSISLAANAVATLTGNPLAERRFLLQFPARALATGQPELAGGLFNLLGAASVDGSALAGYLPDWEKDFLDATTSPIVDKRIAAPRLGYYKLAFHATLAGEFPQAVLWPLLLTWTLAVSVLPAGGDLRWRPLCGMLGLDEGSIGERLADLDHFLDSIEALQERLSASQGL